MDIIKTISEDLAKIRSSKPLVHSITNFVVMNETANAVLCLGGLPIMSHAIEEVEEMVSMAGALVLNIGTLTPKWIEAMELAGKAANAKNIPVILDPVGAGATKLRTESAHRLMKNVRISIVRGNAAETATLAGLSAEIRGVESITSTDMTKGAAGEFANNYGCTAAITGVIDLITDGNRTCKISNGDEMLAKVVGTGCISNVIVAAFAAIQPDSFIATVGGLTVMGIAGEIAAAISGNKPGTFHVELYNALYAITEVDISNKAKIAIC